MNHNLRDGSDGHDDLPLVAAVLTSASSPPFIPIHNAFIDFGGEGSLTDQALRARWKSRSERELSDLARRFIIKRRRLLTRSGDF